MYALFYSFLVFIYIFSQSLKILIQWVVFLYNQTFSVSGRSSKNTHNLVLIPNGVDKCAVGLVLTDKCLLIAVCKYLNIVI